MLGGQITERAGEEAPRLPGALRPAIDVDEIGLGIVADAAQLALVGEVQRGVVHLLLNCVISVQLQGQVNMCPMTSVCTLPFIIILTAPTILAKARRPA